MCDDVIDDQCQQGCIALCTNCCLFEGDHQRDDAKKNKKEELDEDEVTCSPNTHVHKRQRV